MKCTCGFTDGCSGSVLVKKSPKQTCCRQLVAFTDVKCHCFHRMQAGQEACSATFDLTRA